MNAITVAVDLAKTVFELAITDEQGRLVERKRLSREGFARFFAHRPPCRIVMEACGAAHHWARTFQAQGHEVKLLPPQHVRLYVRRNKTDRADAAALLEADRCGDILPVPVKMVEQQGLQGLHRVRSAWMATRTDRINTTRGLLREFGLDLPQGPAAVLTQVPTWLADEESPIPPALRTALTELIAEIRALDTRIAAIEQQLCEQAKPRPEVQRLMAVPGIGLLIATALIAAVGGMEAFRDGRHLAAWLGLTPRESSSGRRRHLGGISKRGDRYLRMLFIHGARSARLCSQRPTRPGPGRNPSPDCSAERSISPPGSATTRPPARWPTNWPASPSLWSARSGPSTAISSRSRPSKLPPVPFTLNPNP